MVLDILLIGFANFVLANSFFELKKNKNWILYYVFYFLFIIPVLLDRVYKFPAYDTGFRYGYVLMGTDPIVTVLYDIVIGFIIFGFYYFLAIKFKEQKPKSNEKFINNPILKIILFAGSLLPIAMFVVACLVSKRSPTLIFDLGWKYKYESGQLGPEIFSYSAIERLTYIGVTCSLLLIGSVDYKKTFFKPNTREDTKRLVLTIVLLLVLVISLGVNILLEGKRSIYLFAGIVFFTVIYYKIFGRIKPWIAIVSFAAFAVIAVFAVVFLGDAFRSASAYGKGFTDYKYTSLRIDFFRDQSLKLVIYSLIHSQEIKVLSFPMQSYLTEIFYLFPIVYLPIPFKKGYETYLTATYSFIDAASLDSMRITNSGLDELCANFSFFGVLIYVLILIWLFKTMNKASDDWNVLIFIGFVLFMMYTTSYVCWYYEFLVGLIVVIKIMEVLKKKKEANAYAETAK